MVAGSNPAVPTIFLLLHSISSLAAFVQAAFYFGVLLNRLLLNRPLSNRPLSNRPLSNRPLSNRPLLNRPQPSESPQALSHAVSRTLTQSYFVSFSPACIKLLLRVSLKSCLSGVLSSSALGALNSSWFLAVALSVSAAPKRPGLPLFPDFAQLGCCCLAAGCQCGVCLSVWAQANSLCLPLAKQAIRVNSLVSEGYVRGICCVGALISHYQ